MTSGIGSTLLGASTIARFGDGVPLGTFRESGMKLLQGISQQRTNLFLHNFVFMGIAQSFAFYGWVYGNQRVLHCMALLYAVHPLLRLTLC